MSNPFHPIIPAELGWYQNLPFSIQYQDIYYAERNGLEQCRHVFIEGNDLIRRWAAVDSSFVIGETGFGTGLNFLLTWNLWEQHAPSHATLFYYSCELHPLRLEDMQNALAAWPELATYAHALVAAYPALTPGFHHLVFNQGRVRLTLMLGEAAECYEQLLICGEGGLETKLRVTYFDAWYLDGFAPAKNPAIWSEDLIRILALLSKPGTTFATYTIAAAVKKQLIQQNFAIEKATGFSPKKHMLKGYKTYEQTKRYRGKQTPWHFAPIQNIKEKKAIIVGAGLAGCYTAYALAQRGFAVTLIDELSDIASGASANEQAVLFPKLSAYRSPMTQFLLDAFVYAYRTYEQFLTDNPRLGALNGCLILANNRREIKTQNNLSFWLSHYPELGELVDSKQASHLAGLEIAHDALFIPHSGYINAKELSAMLIACDSITLLTGETIRELIHNNGTWTVNGISAPYLILANGFKINTFAQTSYLPIKAIRGQLTFIEASAQSALLKIPVCGDGHVLPAINGMHTVGATFELYQNIAGVDAKDDVQNLAKLAHLISSQNWSNHVIGSWSGIRASTPDYLPLVGPIADCESFNTTYVGFCADANRFIPNTANYYSNLFACSGFGARGLTTIPLAAEYIASLINGELPILPRKIMQALSPARFLRKALIRY